MDATLHCLCYEAHNLLITSLPFARKANIACTLKSSSDVNDLVLSF